MKKLPSILETTAKDAICNHGLKEGDKLFIYHSIFSGGGAICTIEELRPEPLILDYTFVARNEDHGLLSFFNWDRVAILTTIETQIAGISPNKVGEIESAMRFLKSLMGNDAIEDYLLEITHQLMSSVLNEKKGNDEPTTNNP